MRIGTWNLAGRWSPGHRALLEGAGCDTWLLTEVPARFDLAGGELLRSDPIPNTGGRSWAAVWSAGPVTPLPSPHEAAALARRDGLVLCSCVLPWRSAGATWPDAAANTAGRTRAALARLRPTLLAEAPRMIWGGDWNHAMSGREHGGSMEGRRAIQAQVDEAELRVATAVQRHAIEGLLSIDHIAVPSTWATACRRILAIADGRRLSDHDAYVVYVTRP